MGSPLGLTGNTSPGNPGATRFCTSRWPSFAGFREAPRTATPRGAKSGARSTVTGFRFAPSGAAGARELPEVLDLVDAGERVAETPGLGRA